MYIIKKVKKQDSRGFRTRWDLFKDETGQDEAVMKVSRQRPWQGIAKPTNQSRSICVMIRINTL